MYPKESIYIQELPGSLLISGLTRNYDRSGYEYYLTEFINNSLYFREKVGFKRILHCDKQSKGECDCYSEDEKYGLDFKLLVSQSYMQALKKTSLICEKDPATGKQVFSDIIFSVPHSQKRPRRLRAEGSVNSEE